MREEGSCVVSSVKVRESLQDVQLFNYKVMSELKTATTTNHRNSVTALHRT